mgnify:CR=1 FL=1
MQQTSEVSRVSRLHLTALKQLRTLVLPACRGEFVEDAVEWHWFGCGSEEGFSNKVSSHMASITCVRSVPSCSIAPAGALNCTVDEYEGGNSVASKSMHPHHDVPSQHVVYCRSYKLLAAVKLLMI